MNEACRNDAVNGLGNSHQEWAYSQQKAKGAAYERAMREKMNVNHEPIYGLGLQGAHPVGQIGNQIKQPGLMDGLHGISDRLDQLHQELSILEDRLSPLTGGAVPTPPINQAQQPEPAAIEEIARIIMRLNSAISTVESITNRVRI